MSPLHSKGVAVIPVRISRTLIGDVGDVPLVDVVRDGVAAHRSGAALPPDPTGDLTVRRPIRPDAGTFAAIQELAGDGDWSTVVRRLAVLGLQHPGAGGARPGDWAEIYRAALPTATGRARQVMEVRLEHPGMSVAQVAAELGITVASAKSAVTRAVRRAGR